MTTTADWAHFYAERGGWRSFPIRPGDKRPLYAAWQKDATVDPALIDQYWRDDERNLGLICGETFDAWDIESAHLEAFSAWANETNAIPPEPPMASTGRGGIHILTAPTGVDGSRNLYLDGTHIGELKSRGGFIVACPSETEGPYEWLHISTDLHLPEATPALRGLLERPVALRKTLPTRIASPDDVVAVLGRLAGSVKYSAGEGRRNNYLYWATRRAIEEGIPARHVVKAMQAAAAEAGLEDEETEKTIASALDAESIAA